MRLYLFFSLFHLFHTPLPTKIAFGSCADFFKLSPSKDIFPAIISSSPSLFFWIGDMAYYQNPSDYSLTSAQIEANMNRISYQELIKKVRVNGIWDDHDYGRNDDIKKNRYKHLIRQLFLDFIYSSAATSSSLPAKSSVSEFDRRFKNQGIYDSILVDEKVKVILLDCRWNKDEWIGDGDMLGEEQWKWLENELSDGKGDLVLIVSGSQILPQNRLFNPFIPESWYSQSRNKLFNLIKKTGRKGVILLSGDVHYGEILSYPNSCSSPIEYPLFEMTSSGLTHHLGESWKVKFYDLVVPDTYNNNSHRFFGFNFGFVEIDWQEEILKSIIKLQIRDFEGKVMLEKRIVLEELGWNQQNATSNKTNEGCEIDKWRGFLIWRNFIDKYGGWYWVIGGVTGLLFVVVVVLNILKVKKTGAKIKKA